MLWKRYFRNNIIEVIPLIELQEVPIHYLLLRLGLFNYIVETLYVILNNGIIDKIPNNLLSILSYLLYLSYTREALPVADLVCNLIKLIQTLSIRELRRSYNNFFLTALVLKSHLYLLRHGD
jgi:hypothetical protein